MVFVEVYHHAEIRRYKAPIVTKATFFVFLFTTLEIICPLLVAYRSYGFWVKEETYTEIPQVRYKYNALLVVGTQTKNYIWSTYSNLNNLQKDNLILPVVKAREVDADRNGNNELLNIQMSMPLPDTETVSSVELLLFFDYRLYRMSYFNMESMAYIHAETVFSSGKLTAVGRLKFTQDSVLGYKGTDGRYASAIIDSKSVHLQEYDISNILARYAQRNVTTRFENEYYRWERNRPPGQPFVLNATVIYTTPTILYKPGFWYVLKWAWIQYVTILLIFVFVFERVKTFVFQNQIVASVVERAYEVDHFHKH